MFSNMREVMLLLISRSVSAGSTLHRFEWRQMNLVLLKKGLVGKLRSSLAEVALV
jgi:hypothetical protein